MPIVCREPVSTGQKRTWRLPLSQSGLFGRFLKTRLSVHDLRWNITPNDDSKTEYEEMDVQHYPLASATSTNSKILPASGLLLGHKSTHLNTVNTFSGVPSSVVDMGSTNSTTVEDIPRDSWESPATSYREWNPDFLVTREAFHHSSSVNVLFPQSSAERSVG